MTTGHMLTVDHDRLAAMDLQQRVTQLGHTVVAIASSGREALASVLRPDVILMDVWLPGPVDGLLAGTQIWVRFGMPVIYVSEHLAAHALQRLWPTCLAGLLEKAARGHNLPQALEEALEPRAPTPVTPEGQRTRP